MGTIALHKCNTGYNPGTGYAFCAQVLNGVWLFDHTPRDAPCSTANGNTMVQLFHFFLQPAGVMSY